MEAAAQPVEHARLRMWGMRGLVVLATLLLILGALGVWIRSVTLDPPTWSDTSGRILEDPTVQKTVATYLVDQLYANVDVAGQIRRVLPEQFKPLAGPAAAGLHDSAERVAVRAFADPRVQRAWRDANEQADRQLVQVIHGDASLLTTSNGSVTLDLHPLVREIAGRVGLADRVSEALPPGAGRIEILRAKQLDLAHKVAHGLELVATFLVLAVLVIFGLAIWIAPDRRRAVRANAIGLIVAGFVLIFIRRVLGGEIIDQVVISDSARPAAHRAWWTATDLLRLGTQSILFVGIVGLLGAWVAGPARRATATRHFLAPYLREPLWAYGGLGAIVLLLLVWSPTPATRNWLTVVLLTAAAAFGLEVLRRQAAAEFPEARRKAHSLSLPRFRHRHPVAAPEDARLARLAQLGQLRRDGVLDDDEFAREKARILDQA